MIKAFLSRFQPLSPSPKEVAKNTNRVNKLIDEGNALEDAGRLRDACDLYRQAVFLAPTCASAHLNLGIVLTALEDREGAALAYQTMLRLDPLNAFGNYNYGRLAYLDGDNVLAEQLLRQALNTKPEFAQALIVLSAVQDTRGATGPAAQSLEAALALEPKNSGAWFNLAALFRKLGRSENAEYAVKQVLAQAPENTDALRLHSTILRDQGLWREALETLRNGIRTDPNRLELISEELLLLNCTEEITATNLFQRHLEFGNKLEALVPVRFSTQNRYTLTNRPLRIGYVSGDFYIHPVALFMIPVLEHHDRSKFEIFCYSSGTMSDRITDRMRSSDVHWVDAAGMSDNELANAIHGDAIDILIDLSGHTGRSRLAVFSQKPAPVQATWLGYLNTTGLRRMDYRLCDNRTDPTALSQALHTEKLLPLPNSQWCYRPLIEVPVNLTTPFEVTGYVTFGSFNSAIKISPSMCKRWGHILLSVPDSRLLIANIPSERKRAEVRQVMLEMGVASERFYFAPRVDLEQYFQLLSSVDIALDTFPYGGGTTTLDALWMGVPVVSALGSTPVSRSAASILSMLGLDQWIAQSVDEYVGIAVGRAANRHAIVALRRSLRQRLKESALADERQFVLDLEASYKVMWTQFMN